MAWTDERIDQLRQMWQQGMTASQIADTLGGVSRNAVIGKAHRLGLQARPSPVNQRDTTPAAEPAEPVEERHAAPAPSPRPQPEIKADAEPTPPPPPPARSDASPPPVPPVDAPVVRSIGPGGFQRQNPHEQQSPIPPAPPRRLVPAKPSQEIAEKTSLLDLNDRICKWPIGHPGEPDFHFCGEPVNPTFPYCLGHCSLAYQAQLPRRDRRPPPPLPYGGPRVR